MSLISGVFPYRYHFLESLGRPRTVLCHTMGKLVVLAKFWVTAIVVSRLRTTCHQPPADTHAHTHTHARTHTHRVSTDSRTRCIIWIRREQWEMTAELLCDYFSFLCSYVVSLSLWTWLEDNLHHYRQTVNVKFRVRQVKSKPWV